MTGQADRTAIVRINAGHLPGVVYELVAMLQGEADKLAIDGRTFSGYDLPPATLSELRADACRVARLAALLDGIGWQTTRAATVLNGAQFLRQTFERMRDDSRAQLDDVSHQPEAWTDPVGTLANFEQALAGAERVLEQLETGRLPQLAADSDESPPAACGG